MGHEIKYYFYRSWSEVLKICFYSHIEDFGLLSKSSGYWLKGFLAREWHDQIGILRRSLWMWWEDIIVGEAKRGRRETQ